MDKNLEIEKFRLIRHLEMAVSILEELHDAVPPSNERNFYADLSAQIELGLFRLNKGNEGVECVEH